MVEMAYFLRVYELPGLNAPLSKAMQLFCDHLPSVCAFGVSLVADQATQVDDPERINVYLTHYPSGGSIKSLDHLG